MYTLRSPSLQEGPNPRWAPPHNFVLLPCFGTCGNLGQNRSVSPKGHRRVRTRCPPPPPFSFSPWAHLLPAAHGVTWHGRPVGSTRSWRSGPVWHTFCFFRNAAGQRSPSYYPMLEYTRTPLYYDTFGRRGKPSYYVSTTCHMHVLP